MKAFTRTLVAFLLFINLCGMGRSEPFVLQTSAVDLHADDDQIGRVGRLIFQGGLNLTSLDPRFGGLSGLAISADGTLLSAVTDRGDWVQFTPILAPTGRLIGIAGAQIGDLQNLDGKPIRAKQDGDAESLIAIDGGFAVSYEHRHRLWFYRGVRNPFLARPTEIALPTKSRAMRSNKGIEALARLRDGRLIAIAEDFPKDATYVQGWIDEINRWHGFQYRRHALYLPAGAATSPDGDLLVLERRFSFIGGFGTRLVAISPNTIRPGGDITGRELARLERPLITENFEGIAAYRNEAGQTILYLVSDDNFLALQRTILLKFVLER